MLGLHNLKAAPKQKRTRPGRGGASGLGTTAGRGYNGQRSRSGGKKGLKLFGLKQTIMKLPKMSGFTHEGLNLKVLNIGDLEKYAEGATVNLRGYKLLGQGKLTKKLIVNVSAFSKTAAEAVNKLGGKINKCGRK